MSSRSAFPSSGGLRSSVLSQSPFLLVRPHPSNCRERLQILVTFPHRPFCVFHYFHCRERVEGIPGYSEPFESNPARRNGILLPHVRLPSGALVLLISRSGMLVYDISGGVVDPVVLTLHAFRYQFSSCQECEIFSLLDASITLGRLTWIFLERTPCSSL